MEIVIGVVAFVIGWILSKKAGFVVNFKGGGESAFLGRIIAAGIIAAVIYVGVTTFFGSLLGISSETDEASSQSIVSTAETNSSSHVVQ